MEFGDPPQTPQEIGENEKTRYSIAWTLAKTGKLLCLTFRTP